MRKDSIPLIATVVLLFALGFRGAQVTYDNFAQRGIRNNNPGNIEKSSDAWQGLAPVQTDSRFFQFTAPEWGIRALARVLKNYQTRHGINTLRGVVNRWAPATENPTEQYIRNLEAWTGFNAAQYINLQDTATLAKLVPAIIRMENGEQPYPASLIAKGISLA